MISDKQSLSMQRFICAGMSFEQSGEPEEAREVWDQLTAEIKVLSDHGVLVETVNEWADYTDDDLKALYAPWTEEEIAAMEAGISLDELYEGKTTLISKSVEERRFTLGPMYIPNRMDAHAEWTDPEELQNAVWEYVRKGDRRIRLQHNRDVVAGEFVEVMAWPYPVEVPMVQKSGATENMTFPANTVFLGVVWEPWAWELVKENKLRGYSIGGRAERLLADLPEEYVGKAMAPFGDAIRIEAVD